jgi:hypothetical protein
MRKLIGLRRKQASSQLNSEKLYTIYGKLILHDFDYFRIVQLPRSSQPFPYSLSIKAYIFSQLTLPHTLLLTSPHSQYARRRHGERKASPTQVRERSLGHSQYYYHREWSRRIRRCHEAWCFACKREFFALAPPIYECH